MNAGRPSLTALLTWLLRQMTEESKGGSGTRVIRLDSDVHAGTLSTIHASKRLQYPIVYASFLFSNYIRVEDPVVVHQGGERVIAFAEDRGARATAGMDVQDEDLRLAYVAMPRAQSQLQIAAGVGIAESCLPR